jgi:hypothetical protein
MYEGIQIQTTMVGEGNTCERIKILLVVLLEIQSLLGCYIMYIREQFLTFHLYLNLQSK